MNKDEKFLEYRSLLFSISYDMLGSIQDAEDAVQETYLKWISADTLNISHPKAFMVKIITNSCINYLKTARKKREAYTGLWLPEPIINSESTKSVESVDMYHTLSIGMMYVLEKLTAHEKAVFLLKEIFAYDYSEISEIIGKSVDNCRQIFKRAKDHLKGNEKRFKVDIKTHEKILDQFIKASSEGDLDGLIKLLKEDIIIYADGGGRTFVSGSEKIGALNKPLKGKYNSAMFVIKITDKVQRLLPYSNFKKVIVNGLPSIMVSSDKDPFSVICLEITGDKISNIYSISNPEKLKHFIVNTSINSNFNGQRIS